MLWSVQSLPPPIIIGFQYLSRARDALSFPGGPKLKIFKNSTKLKDIDLSK